jgi:DNA-binding beta-propeller fold protein YncE
MSSRAQLWLAALFVLGLAAPAPAGGALPRRGGQYFGATSQGGTVVATVGRDAGRVRSLDLDVRARCTGRDLARPVKYETLYLTRFPIGADSRFGRTGRVTRYDSSPDETERFLVEVTGTLSGGFPSPRRLTGTARLRLAGRFFLYGGSDEGLVGERATCRTGTVRFSAEIPRESRGRTGALRERRRPAACLFSRRRARCRHVPGLGAPDRILLTPDGRHAYVVSATEVDGAAGTERSTLFGFRRDRRTGALTKIPGPAGCARPDAAPGCTEVRGVADAGWAAMSPDGRSVYLVDAYGTGVATLQRDSATGALTQPPGAGGCLGPPEEDCAPSLPADAVWSPEVSPDGRQLYLAWNRGEGLAADRGLLWLARDRGTGLLGPPGTGNCASFRGTSGCARAPFTGRPLVLAFAPSGSNVYAGLAGSPLLALARRADTGALRPLREPETCHFALNGPRGCRRRGDDPDAVAVSPDGRSLYYAFDEFIAVLARRPGGGLEQLPGQAGCVALEEIGGCLPARGLDFLNVMELSPDGRTLYTGDYGDGLMAVFERRHDGRLLQLGGPAGCLKGLHGEPIPLNRPWHCVRTWLDDEVNAIAASHDGRHVYVASGMWPDRGGLHLFTRAR